jgi:hypothetical protein
VVATGLALVGAGGVDDHGHDVTPVVSVSGWTGASNWQFTHKVLVRKLPITVRK